MGCLDCQHPYSESANVVMVDSAEMIERILEVSDDLGLDLRIDRKHLGRSVALPCSFPPALCDEELLLQQTLLQIGTAFATDSAAEDFAVATLRQHGICSESLLHVSEEDFVHCLEFGREEDEVLSRAQELLAKAMKYLRHVEATKRWISEDLLGKELVDQAWQELKLRKEWAEVEVRWNQCTSTRKSKNKKTRQKENAERAEVIDESRLREKLQQAVTDMNKKVWKCRTYHKFFCLLQRRELLDYLHADATQPATGHLALPVLSRPVPVSPMSRC